MHLRVRASSTSQVPVNDNIESFVPNLDLNIVEIDCTFIPMAYEV
jgi:hypothetical protein